MKVVINTCYGGFSLSRQAYEFLDKKWDGHGYGFNLKRHNPKLVECIEKLGESANGLCADLKIIEIPDDVDYIIEEYDGIEHIAERHRTWM